MPIKIHHGVINDKYGGYKKALVYLLVITSCAKLW